MLGPGRVEEVLEELIGGTWQRATTDDVRVTTARHSSRTVRVRVALTSPVSSAHVPVGRLVLLETNVGSCVGTVARL
jgi:hypothetical protein